MCGHGTIGVVATLAHLGRIAARRAPHRDPGRQRHRDAACRRHGHRGQRAGVPARGEGRAWTFPGHGVVHGDVAWGGNWFFLCGDHGLPLEVGRVDELTAFALRVRDALRQTGVTGAGGAEIDHVELFGRARRSGRTTPATSCSARAAPTIARPAARAPARSSPASQPTASSRRARRGARKASSAASSRAATRARRLRCRTSRRMPCCR